MEINLTLKDYRTKADIAYADYLAFKPVVPEGTATEELDIQFVTMRMLQIFYKIKPKDAKHLDELQVAMLLNKVSDALNLPASPLKKVITVNGIAYGLIDFKTMTVGELIDMDKMFTDEKYPELTSIVYRPITKWSDDEYQIAKYDGYNNAFENVSVEVVEGYVPYFASELQAFKEVYKYLYGSGEGEEVSDDFSIGITARQAFTMRYGGYMEFIYLILNGDMMRIEEAFKMNAHQFMFLVEYLIRKNKVEQIKTKK